MIYKNNKTINEWYFNDSELIKVYKNGAICYYKMVLGGTPSQEPCFAVVNDITQYSDTEFVDVYDKATEKWYKLNNLDQYEEYGVYGSGRTITYYEGKLTIDNGYEYEWDGSEWNNLGEVSGSTIIIHSPEYLERTSSSNGYFPLGETFQLNTTIEMDFQMTQAKGNAIIGDYGTNDSNDWRLFLNYDSATNNLLSYDFLNTRVQYNTGNWAKRFNLRIGNYYIDDIDTGTRLINSTRKTSFTRPNQMYLFHMEGSQITNNTDYGHIYSVKIYQDGTLVKDYIPWADGNGTYGMWDKVSNQSVTSVGQMTGSSVVHDIDVGGDIEYPKYYTEKDEPENNVVFTDMAEALAYQCPWVGMMATIGTDMYIFSGDSQSGYEWVEVTLPYDAEIEYLESDGASYIDTGIYLNTSNFEIGYEQVGVGTEKHWGYAHQGVPNGAWVSVLHDIACFGQITNYVTISPYLTSGNNILKYTQSGITVNGTTLSKTFSLSGVDNLNSVSVPIFSWYDFYSIGMEYSQNLKYKSFYIKNNGTLVVDMIPVRKDGVGYMYDRVSGQLFGNAGTGDFIIGPDVV